MSLAKDVEKLEWYTEAMDTLIGEVFTTLRLPQNQPILQKCDPELIELFNEWIRKYDAIKEEFDKDI